MIQLSCYSSYHFFHSGKVRAICSGCSECSQHSYIRSSFILANSLSHFNALNLLYSLYIIGQMPVKCLYVKQYSRGKSSFVLTLPDRYYHQHYPSWLCSFLSAFQAAPLSKAPACRTSCNTGQMPN